MQYSPFPVISSLLAQDIPVSTQFPKNHTLCPSLTVAHQISHPTKQQSPAICCSLLTLHVLTPKGNTNYSVPRGSRHSAVQPVLNFFVNAIKICQLYSKYLNLAKVLKNMFKSWLSPEFFHDTWTYRQLYQYFLPFQPPFYWSTSLLCFLIITSYIFNSLFMISTNSNELKSSFLYCFYPDISIMFKTFLQHFPGVFLNPTAVSWLHEPSVLESFA